MRGTCANQVLLYLNCMSQPNYSNVVHPLQLSLRWQAELSCTARDRCWDALGVWCDQRGAFLGGEPDLVFILTRRGASPLQPRLSRWLSHQPCIASFDLASDGFAALEHSSTPGPHANQCSPALERDVLAARAMMEALANYQQHLVEEFQGTIAMVPMVMRFIKKPLKLNPCA